MDVLALPLSTGIGECIRVRVQRNLEDVVLPQPRDKELDLAELRPQMLGACVIQPKDTIAVETMPSDEIPASHQSADYAVEGAIELLPLVHARVTLDGDHLFDAC